MLNHLNALRPDTPLEMEFDAFERNKLKRTSTPHQFPGPPDNSCTIPAILWKSQWSLHSPAHRAGGLVGVRERTTYPTVRRTAREMYDSFEKQASECRSRRPPTGRNQKRSRRPGVKTPARLRRRPVLPHLWSKVKRIEFARNVSENSWNCSMHLWRTMC